MKRITAFLMAILTSLGIASTSEEKLIKRIEKSTDSIDYSFSEELKGKQIPMPSDSRCGLVYLENKECFALTFEDSSDEPLDTFIEKYILVFEKNSDGFYPLFTAQDFTSYNYQYIGYGLVKPEEYSKDYTITMNPDGGFFQTYSSMAVVWEMLISFDKYTKKIGLDMDRTYFGFPKYVEEVTTETNF